ncbi:MAG: type II secretion system protein [Verrucomicrobiota bacterium]
MMSPLYSKRRGFTLVEIMVVVAIIALLASLAIPNYVRMRKRTQSMRILTDLKLIDEAIDQYALASKKTAGTPVQWGDIQPYIKANSHLYSSGGVDLLGNSFQGFAVDSTPLLAPESFEALSDVAPADFWAPYK